MRTFIQIVENALMEAGDAPLYHATSFQNAKHILADGCIRAFGGDERGYICTSRDRNLLFKGQHVQFVINTGRVRTRYAIRPVDFFAGFANARRDSEERIMAQQLPLSMVDAVMLMPIQKYAPGIMAVMYREGDEIAALAAERGIEVIDLRPPILAQQEPLAETFDSQVEWTWLNVDSTFDDAAAQFKIDGVEYVAHFNQIGMRNNYSVDFTAKVPGMDRDTINITGTGNAFKVYGTMGAIIRDFLRQHPVGYLRISSGEDSPARFKTNLALAKRIAREIGFSVDVDDGSIYIEARK